MYIRSQARKRKLGWALLNQLVEETHQIGYERSRLDSTRVVREAHQLCQNIDFHEIEVYEGCEIPKEFQNRWIFRERELLLKNDLTSNVE
jgi:hypothetical protein